MRKQSPTVGGPRKIPQLLTVAELEERLKIDRKTIYDYAKRGEIPSVKIYSHVRFIEDDIADWVQSRTRPTRACKAR